MSKETRVSADRVLRAEHLRSKITWYNCRLERIEQFIMDNMRSYDPDENTIARLVKEREDIIIKCKKVHKNLYG
jgi:hypothetical protein